jgi:ABC-type spermidine/putrescine transport system permease subunit II
VNFGASGLTFASLAGVAGALGAIGVVFATSAAMGAARAEGLKPDSYKVFIAPLIFGTAPVINVLVSMFWHPQKGDPWVFGVKNAHPVLWLGIVLVGIGAALVLYSKELTEASEHKAPPAKASSATQAAANPSTAIQGAPGIQTGSETKP